MGIYVWIIDVFTREIVGYHEGSRYIIKEAFQSLDEAIENRNADDLVLITDNGAQFRRESFRQGLENLKEQW